MLLASTALAQNLPTGGSVAAGNATIAQTSPNHMTVNQGSDTAIVNWNTFDVGTGSTLDFNQPSSDSAILNRVTGNTTSDIHGQLNANGQVHLINPNGIYIGPSGKISTGGFVASTLDISNDDFLRGDYRYQGNGNSNSVENAGQIISKPGSYAALIGGQVSNSGLIQVPLGKVGLGAGELVTLDVSGDGFMQVAVPSDSDDKAMEALVRNSGRISADGGLVQLLGASAHNAARQVVNMSGIIEARTVGGVSGAVVLGGGKGSVHVSGRIDTSARAEPVYASPRPATRPDNGGSITITGADITLAGATLDASGAGDGNGGEIRVGGDYQGGGDLQTASTTVVDADTAITADGGSTGDGGLIVIWSDDYTEFAGTNSARGGDEAGDGGLVEVSGKYNLQYTGSTDTRAPNGTWGTLLLDPLDIYIVDTLTGRPGDIEAATLISDLGMNNVTLTTSDPDFFDQGNITVDADLTWTSGSTLELIANNIITINGAINAINGGLILTALGEDNGGIGLITANASVNVAYFSLVSGFWQQVSAVLPSFFAADFEVDSDADFLRVLGGDGTDANPYQLTDVYGLQGIGGPSLSDLSYVLANDIDASVTTGWGNSGSFVEGFEPIDFSGTLNGNRHAIDGLFIDVYDFGGLFGFLTGTVIDLSITNADVTTAFGGILAGANDGTVIGVMTSGTVTTVEGVGGGLVGSNGGTITDSFSTADVNATTFENNMVEAGGLAGRNSGTIERSNSNGTVTVEDDADSFYVGGLVGSNQGTILDSYSTSDVSVTLTNDNFNTAYLGGLVGFNDSGATISRTFSTGSMNYSGFGTVTYGGLVAVNAGTVSASFWDTQSSGQGTSDGGTPLTTAELQDTQGFYDLASAQGWDFTTNWAPGSGSSNPANYTTSPVVFAIPDDIAVEESDVPTAATTGDVFGGPSFYRFGPAPDTLDTSPIFRSLDFADTSVGSTSFTVDTGDLSSAGGQVYNVVALPGTAEITADPVVPPVDTPVDPPVDPPIDIPDGTDLIPSPPLPSIEITPTVDTTIQGSGTAVQSGSAVLAALDTIETTSSEFEEQLSSCASRGEDVSQYLACLADAMDDYAADLDKIVEGLPPGLESVGDIIRGASAGIRQVGADAQKRLSLASTVEERAAIRRSAAGQARDILQNTQREIRKEITLIRASDPELASIQKLQVERVASAVGEAEISLSRAIGL